MKHLFLLSLAALLPTTVFGNTPVISTQHFFQETFHEDDTGNVVVPVGETVKIFFEFEVEEANFRGYLHCILEDQTPIDTNIEIFIKQDSPDYVWCSVPLEMVGSNKISILISDTPLTESSLQDILAENNPYSLVIKSDVDNDNDFIPNSVDDDNDNDGLSNLEEAVHGTSEFVSDTDGDGLSDAKEVEIGSDPTQADTDQDSLSDRDEIVVYQTDPTNADTDGDSIQDGREIIVGGDPTNDNTDGDCFTDGEELKYGTSVSDPNSSNECYTVIEEATTSPQAAANQEKLEREDIAEQVRAIIANPPIYRGSPKLDPDAIRNEIEDSRIYRGSIKINPYTNVLENHSKGIYRGSVKIDPDENILEPEKYARIFRGSQKINPNTNVLEPTLTENQIEKVSPSSISSEAKNPWYEGTWLGTVIDFFSGLFR